VPDEPHDPAATVRAWVDLVRRARLGRTDKAVAFALAHYADANGRRIFPGVARLSIECELTYNIVQQVLHRLRTRGLIEVVRRGTTRGRADEYRLIISPEIIEHVVVMSPTDVTRAMEKVTAAHRGKHRVKPDPDPHPTRRGAADDEPSDEGNDLHPTGTGAASEAEPVDNDSLHPTAHGAADGAPEPAAPHGVGSETAAAPHGVVPLHPTPCDTTSHRPATRTTTHTTADLVDHLAPSRAQGRQGDTIQFPRVVTEPAPYRSRHAAPDSEPESVDATVLPFRRPESRAS
jgi:DNA-binding IscR family transcriptional regulator